jgi:type II secretory ATPase GspE/PulE/Tfp pilus assembly ATPase PilB-like protein
LALKNCSLSNLEAQFEREGISTMLDDGLVKAKAGVTTLEELTRVLG